MLRHETRQNVEIYRRLRKQETLLFQAKERRFEESDEQLLEPLATNFVGSYQAGFVGGKSTIDQIFTLLQILQKWREHQTPTHHLFIDFKAAYDTIDRNEQ